MHLVGAAVGSTDPSGAEAEDALRLLMLALARRALLAAALLGLAAAQCENAAGDANCATYTGALGGSLVHCESELKPGLTVADVCAKACGTLLEADADGSCFSATYTAGQPFFANCCQVALNFPAGSPLACGTADCTTCWGSPLAAGLWETCCLDKDPCRDEDCGHGKCVSSGYTDTCHCEPGWRGADGEVYVHTCSAVACDSWVNCDRLLVITMQGPIRCSPLVAVRGHRSGRPVLQHVERHPCSPCPQADGQ